MNPEFLASIESPDQLALQNLRDDAIAEVRKELRGHHVEDVSEATIRRFAYTYYHDWEEDNPDIVFLLEDPGMPGEHVLAEAHEIDEVDGKEPNRELLKIFRRFGARWLMQKRYADFTSQFVATCEEAGLIDPDDPWWKYLLSYDFFDDFYMCDVVKYRAPNVSDADLKAAFTEHLVHELEYVDPDLVFTFGKRAWNCLRTNLGAEPVDGSVDPTRMNSVHGAPARTTRLLDVDVIPLGHMSPNFLGAQMSHRDYFKKVENALSGLY